MIHSIQANSTVISQQQSVKANSIQKASVSTPATSTSVSESKDGTVETSAQGDVLTISSAGSMLSKSLSATAESGDIATDNGYQDSTAQALASAANAVGINDASAAKSEQASTSGTSSSNLTSYSEAQLKEMLNNGEITQAEYNAEIKSRQEKSTGGSDENGNFFQLSATDETEA